MSSWVWWLSALVYNAKKAPQRNQNQFIFCFRFCFHRQTSRNYHHSNASIALEYLFHEKYLKKFGSKYFQTPHERVKFYDFRLRWKLRFFIFIQNSILLQTYLIIYTIHKNKLPNKNSILWRNRKESEMTCKGCWPSNRFTFRVIKYLSDSTW